LPMRNVPASATVQCDTNAYCLPPGQGEKNHRKKLSWDQLNGILEVKWKSNTKKTTDSMKKSALLISFALLSTAVFPKPSLPTETLL